MAIEVFGQIGSSGILMWLLPLMSPFTTSTGKDNFVVKSLLLAQITTVNFIFQLVELIPHLRDSLTHRQTTNSGHSLFGGAAIHISICPIVMSFFNLG